jgi:parallel beta-helix repeat protein
MYGMMKKGGKGMKCRAYWSCQAFALIAVLCLSITGAAVAKVIVVRTSIQDAVDAANPGDTIVVPPGVYYETVLVAKDNLTIRGSTAAILDATGFDDGIRVGTGRFSRDSTGALICPPLEVHNFTLDGLTIRNAGENGIFLIGVEGFHLTQSRYLNNGEYGPFPVCSRAGLIAFNVASGHNDAAIYVGDDDNVIVRHNRVTRSVIGIEIENSSNTVVQHNWLSGNTVGILAVVLPGLPMAATQGVWIEHNVLLQNNLPNPIAVDSGDPVGLLPTGTGILNIGGDEVVMRHNVVIGHNSVGIAIVANPFAPLDPRIEPFPDNNEVRNNIVLRNGRQPDPERATTPGVDLVYDGSGGGNCFDHNLFQTQFPEGITGFFPCP